jgi:hypothetical protein
MPALSSDIETDSSLVPENLPLLTYALSSVLLYLSQELSPPVSFDIPIIDFGGFPL